MTNPEENKNKPKENPSLPPTPPATNIQEIINKGNEIYNGLKNVLEPIHTGKYVVIEIKSGRYFLGGTRDEAIANARKEFPSQIMFIKRVGQVEKSSRHFSTSHHSQYKYARLF